MVVVLVLLMFWWCVNSYKVQAFSAEESGWYGAYGIKLTSIDEEKRQWLFRAPSESEQIEWMEVRARIVIAFLTAQSLAVLCCYMRCDSTE